MSQPSLQGPVGRHRHKNSLINIAEVLGVPDLPPTENIKVHVAKIKKFMKQNEERIVNDPLLQGLVTYRTGSMGTGRDASKFGGKTSADKAAEDEAESHKEPPIPSGANKKLLEQKLTTDPPAQFKPLKKQIVTKDVISRLSSPDMAASDLSSPPSAPLSPPPSTADEADLFDEQPPSTPRKAESKRPCLDAVNIVVRFRDYDNKDAEAQEVWLRPGKGVVLEEREVNGEQEVVTKLSELLPAALDLSTPVKERRGRLFRAGITHSGHRVSLGTVDAILAGKAEQVLSMDKVNNYALTTSADDPSTLLCEVYLKDDPNDRSNALMTQSNTLAAATVKKAKAKRRTPVEIGPSDEESATPTPTPRKGDSLSSTSIVEYLKDILEGPDHAWPKAERAIDVLMRRKAVVNALEHIKSLGWSRSTGGYQIPKGYRDAGSLAGHTFTREQVYSALLIKHSQAAGDALLFKEDVMDKLPRLRSWFDDPDGPENSRFASMSITKLKDWQDRKLKEKRERTVAGRIKRNRSGDEGDRVQKRKKASGSNRSRVSDDFADNASDDLDS